MLMRVSSYSLARPDQNLRLLLSLKARLNDRDEIRRKLAAGNESEGENEDYYTSDYIKKSLGTASHRRRQGTEKAVGTFNGFVLMTLVSSIMIKSKQREWMALAMKENRR